MWHVLNSVVPCSASQESLNLGRGMICFAGGANESIYAWDLRGGHARPIYELSTGNQTVKGLAWHPGTDSLFAACQFVGESHLSKSDFKRLDEGTKWPHKARHEADEVKHIYSQPYSVLLHYHFLEDSKKEVPKSPKPEYPGDAYW